MCFDPFTIYEIERKDIGSKLIPLLMRSPRCGALPPLAALCKGFVCIQNKLWGTIDFAGTKIRKMDCLYFLRYKCHNNVRIVCYISIKKLIRPVYLSRSSRCFPGKFRMTYALFSLAVTTEASSLSFEWR